VVEIDLGRSGTSSQVFSMVLQAASKTARRPAVRVDPMTERPDTTDTERTSPETGPARGHLTTYVPIGNVTTPIHRPLPARLLGVWAHPDDECYLSAGLMARVIGAGGAARLLCATRGERGTDDAALFGTERFAEHRQAELEASLAVLGVTDLRFLGLGDGECADADPARMAADLGAEIEAFGPDGITGHPDHLAVSRWATAAATTTGTADLLYATVTHEHAARYRTLNEELGLYDALEGGRPVSVPRSQVALQCSLDRGELIRKRRALSRHGSQTDRLAASIGEEVYLTWWQDECFRNPSAVERSGALRAIGPRRRSLIGAGS
jgi:LmbE family N-acetylglucosaminyl deacetylase